MPSNKSPRFLLKRIETSSYGFQNKTQQPVFLLRAAFHYNGFMQAVSQRSEPGPPGFPDWTAAGTAVVGGLLLAPLLYLAPLVGWDWYTVYVQHNELLFWYPVWTSLLTSPLTLTLPWRVGLAVSNGLTVSALAIATLRESRVQNHWGYVGALMAVFTPAVFVLLWAGQVDGWALLGYLLLPWGVPFLLIKPTIGAFALLARKQWFLAGLAFGAATLLLWPGWPLQAVGIHVVGDYPHVATMGWYKLGWPIGALGLVLMLFTDRNDPLQLMAAGTFLMPYVFPYHLVLIFPVLGRFNSVRQLILWLSIWVSALPFMFGSAWAPAGYVFPMAAWLALRARTAAQDTWLAELQLQWVKLRDRFKPA